MRNRFIKAGPVERYAEPTLRRLVRKRAQARLKVNFKAA